MLKNVIVISTPEINDYFRATRTGSWNILNEYEPVPGGSLWESLKQNNLLGIKPDILILGEELLSEDSDGLATIIANFCADTLVLCISYNQNDQSSIRIGVSEKLTNDKATFSFINGNKDTDDEINAAIELWDKAQSEHNKSYSIIEKVNEPVEESQIKISTTEAEVVIPLETLDVSAEAKTGNGPYGLLPLGQRGMIVTFTSTKGGVGKSTLSCGAGTMIHHASRLAQKKGLRDQPLKVCVVDMDLQDSQLSLMIGKVVPTIMNYYLDGKFTISNLKSNLIVSPETEMGTSFLLAPKVPKTADFLDIPFLGDTIAKLTTQFDVVILDTSVNFLDKIIKDLILPISDAVIFVTSMAKGSTGGMARWIKEVTSEKDGKPNHLKDKIGIVVNQAMQNSGVFKEDIIEAAQGIPILAAIPLDTQAVVSAANNYRLYDIILKHPTISPAYYEIISQLLPNEVLVAPHKILAEAVAKDNKSPGEIQIIPAGSRKKRIGWRK